jgi:lipoyl(octanoyl) transferase
MRPADYPPPGTGSQGSATPTGTRSDGGPADRPCARPPLWWTDVGQCEYAVALALQHRLHAARRQGAVPDTLLAMEHPPTITLGRRAGGADLRVGTETLAARGVDLHRVGRGGRATYHAPGQLVVYPIVDLRRLGLGPRRFVDALERAIVEVLAGAGVAAHRRPGIPGVWVAGAKIAAIGLEIAGGVTRHGLAINLDVDLTPFDLIVPCGDARLRPTSLRALGVVPPSCHDAAAALATALGATLGLTPREVTEAALEARAPQEGAEVAPAAGGACTRATPTPPPASTRLG